MPIINREVFVKQLMAADPPIPREGADAYRSLYLDYRGNLRAEVILAAGNQRDIREALSTVGVDRESALRVLDQLKEYVKERGYLTGKYLRPWNVDKELYSRLDQTVPWLGFEFETGWNSRESRAEAIEHCWNTWDNVVFDSEGEGVPVEITFAPQELSKYKDGTADAYQFMQYLAANKNTARSGRESVGTHVNISLPFMREYTRGGNSIDIQDSLCDKLNTSIGLIADYEARIKHFGRDHLYAGFFVGEGSTWLEGKLFRTAYTMEEFKRYLHTSEMLVLCAQALHDAGTEGSYAVTNLLALLEGQEDTPKVERVTRHLDVNSFTDDDDEDDYEDDDCDCEICREARGETDDEPF